VSHFRDLDLIGNFPVVVPCQIREWHLFGGLLVQQRHSKRLSSLVVIDLMTCRQIGIFEVTSGCTELYDVHFLPGLRRVNILSLGDYAVRQAFTVRQFSYWLRPENMVPNPLPNESPST